MIVGLGMFVAEIQVDTNHVCKNYVNLCKNGGTCVDDEEDSYYCLCPPGWRGTQCSLGNGKPKLA